jgi:hypothetical protein
MRNGTVSAALAAVLLILFPAAAGAETRVFGGAAGWASFPERVGISESAGMRNRNVLTLSSAVAGAGPSGDLSLSFDGAAADAVGNYLVSVPSSVSIAGPQRARFGSGAALFMGAENGVSISPKPGKDALFGAGRRMEDFSIEFWLYPANMENGEQILSWDAARRSASGESVFQRIRCLVARNRVEWSFADFFSAPDERGRLPIVLSTTRSLVPRTWSHHLVRFDSSVGLLEYLVDGRVESSVYATASGGERGERYVPIVGSSGAFVLGPRFTGMIDEFRISGSAVDSPELRRFPRSGGRAISGLIDLGTTNAEVTGLDSVFSAPGTSEIRFFLRTGDEPYAWKDVESSWIPVQPGMKPPLELRGRWAQISCVLYPAGDGETAPVLEELRLDFKPDEPPPPPSMVTAAARNGAVELKWRPSPDADLGGYLIYFGENAGEYFGSSATRGDSPLDVGNTTSYVVDGLRDGTLYYFSIAAYDRASPRHIGGFSREVAARPARTVDR